MSEIPLDLSAIERKNLIDSNDDMGLIFKEYRSECPHTNTRRHLTYLHSDLSKLAIYEQCLADALVVAGLERDSGVDLVDPSVTNNGSYYLDGIALGIGLAQQSLGTYQSFDSEMLRAFNQNPLPQPFIPKAEEGTVENIVRAYSQYGNKVYRDMVQKVDEVTRENHFKERVMFISEDMRMPAHARSHYLGGFGLMLATLTIAQNRRADYIQQIETLPLLDADK